MVTVHYSSKSLRELYYPVSLHHIIGTSLLVKVTTFPYWIYLISVETIGVNIAKELLLDYEFWEFLVVWPIYLVLGQISQCFLFCDQIQTDLSFWAGFFNTSPLVDQVYVHPMRGLHSLPWLITGQVGGGLTYIGYCTVATSTPHPSWISLLMLSIDTNYTLQCIPLYQMHIFHRIHGYWEVDKEKY